MNGPLLYQSIHHTLAIFRCHFLIVVNSKKIQLSLNTDQTFHHFAPMFFKIKAESKNETNLTNCSDIFRTGQLNFRRGYASLNWYVSTFDTQITLTIEYCNFTTFVQWLDYPDTIVVIDLTGRSLNRWKGTCISQVWLHMTSSWQSVTKQYITAKVHLNILIWILSAQ